MAQRRPPLQPVRTTRHLNKKKMYNNRHPGRYVKQVMIAAQVLVRSVKGNLSRINRGKVEAVARTNGVNVPDLVRKLEVKYGIRI